MGREKKILAKAAALFAAALALWLVDRLAPADPAPVAPAADGRPADLPAAERCAVTKVVDGDTLRVSCGGAPDEPVRLVGVDAPEVARQGNAAECWAGESTAALAVAVGGGDVFLAPDPAQPDRDRYGRLLRFVATTTEADPAAPWRGSVNLALVRAGAAGAYSGIRYGGGDDFAAAANAAQAEALGLWGSCPSAR